MSIRILGCGGSLLNTPHLGMGQMNYNLRPRGVRWGGVGMLLRIYIFSSLVYKLVGVLAGISHFCIK